MPQPARSPGARHDQTGAAAEGGAPRFHVHVQVLHARPERDVLRARHVLEQRVALEHEADAPVLDGDVCRVRVCRPAAAAPLQARGRATGNRLVEHARGNAHRQT